MNKKTLEIVADTVPDDIQALFPPFTILYNKSKFFTIWTCDISELEEFTEDQEEALSYALQIDESIISYQSDIDDVLPSWNTSVIRAINHSLDEEIR